MRSIRVLAILIASSVLFISTNSLAQSPIGNWTTYDLNNTPRSIVQIYQTGNTLSGRIVKELNPKNGTVAQPLCTVCPGQWKNKPKKGMVVVWGLRKSGEQWVNGNILDTDSGKIYSCQISVAQGGRVLNFRAYVATPLFGKTIPWTRAGK